MEEILFIFHIITGTLIVGFGLVVLSVYNRKTVSPTFRIAKNLLASYLIITGISFYLAHAAGKYDDGKVEILKFSSISICFIAGSLLMASFIFMFELKSFLGRKTLLKRVIVPLSAIFIYLILAVIFGDPKIYSLPELFSLIPNRPILVLRLIIAVVAMNFFLYLLRKLQKVREENRKVAHKICDKDERLNRKTELIYFIGTGVIILSMASYYFAPSLLMSYLLPAMLVVVNLLFTVTTLNYQATNQRLRAMVKFVESAGDSKSTINYALGKQIRQKINTWSQHKCKHGVEKVITLHETATEIGIDTDKLYEFITYEYGLNFDQWIMQIRIRCICENLRSNKEAEALSRLAGFSTIESMEDAFIESKHLSIEEFKTLNIVKDDAKSDEESLSAWIYDPDNLHVRILMENKPQDDPIALEEISVRLGEEKARIIHKVAHDANLGIFESRSYNYSITDLSKEANCKDSKVMCIPIQFLEESTPMIIGLELDITKHKVITHKLIKLISEVNSDKIEAIESRDLRTSMLASVGHDIRTPLNAVIGFSQLMQSADSDEERKEYSKIISSSASALSTLISDLLDFARLDSGHIEFSSTYFNLNQLIDEIHLSLKSSVNSQVEFIKQMPLEYCMVHFDRARLFQVVTNFTTNAIKFTQKGKITLGYKSDQEGIMLYVKDSGCGIAEENKEKVFKRFERFNYSKPGTGLGLNICKAIADASDSKIGFDSVLKEGSTFWFIISQPNCSV